MGCGTSRAAPQSTQQQPGEQSPQRAARNMSAPQLKAGTRVRAKYPYKYEGKKKNFFSFGQGDEFTLLAKGSKNAEWRQARREDGPAAVGYVPVNFMAAVPVSEQAPTPPVAPSAAAGVGPAKEAHFALYDFQPVEPEQGSLQQGHVYWVTRKDSDGWFTVEDREGKVSIVPANYIMAMDTGSWMGKPWFHGAIAADVARMRLLKDSGNFLLREDAARGDRLFLVMRSGSKAVQEVAITRSPKGYVLQGDGIVREKLFQLLDYYAGVEVKTGWGKLRAPCPAPPVVSSGATPPAAQPTATSAAPARALSKQEMVAQIEAEMEALYVSTSSTSRTQLAALVAQRQSLLQAMSEPATAAAPGASAGTAAAASKKTPSRSAPPPPTRAATTTKSHTPRRHAPAPPTSGTASSKKADPSPAPVPQPEPVASLAAEAPRRAPTPEPMPAPVDPEEVLRQIGGVVQMVRDASGVSFDQSRLACEALLEFLLHETSSDPRVGHAIARAIQKSEGSVAGGGEDAVRLREIIRELTEMKNDAQQRSWSVYDDAGSIKGLLDECTALVEDGDAAVVAKIVREFHSPGQVGSFYEFVDTLVRYYQMETRMELRLVLLKLFGALGTLDARVFVELQTSVLPVELARDIMVDPHSDENSQKVLYSCLLSTMIFSCGLPLPIVSYDYLNLDFVNFLLDLVEYENKNDVDESIADQAVNMVLGFNLHFAAWDPFADGDANMVMVAVSAKHCKVFSEKIMELANRGEDPVRVDALVTGHEHQPKHSVVKLLKDVFSRPELAKDLFYTNDLRVLFDVLLRELSNREHGDLMRVDYGQILDGVLRNSDLWDEPYRQPDLTKCMDQLLEEENFDNDSSTEQVKAMASTLKAMFCT